MLENSVVLSATIPGTSMTQAEALKAHRPNHPLLRPIPLDNYDHYILWVFRQLDRDRMSDMGTSPIRMRSITDYQELFNDELSFEEIMMIQQLDMSYINKKAEIRKNLYPDQ